MSLEFASELRPRLRRPAVRTAGITAWGAALPETVVGNEQVGAGAGVSPEWIVKRTGITERRRARADERLDLLCAAAGREALERAGLAATELDAVLIATSTADEIFPQCAPLVAGHLGAGQAMAWDVGLACTGYVAGVAQAAALIESGRAEHVLLVGGDILSRHLDPTDRGPAALFGDGAGASVLSRGGAGRVGASVFGTDGPSGHFLTESRAEQAIRMDGIEVFHHAIARMGECSQQVLEQEGIALQDVTLVVPHQANGRITASLAERLALRPDQVVDDIADRGNTSAATIPLALHRAQAAGRIPERGTVLITAFGAGFAWGAAVLHYGGPAR